MKIANKLSKKPANRPQLRLSKTVSKALKRGTGVVERPLATLRQVHTPKTARAWLGQSLADVGREIARLTRRLRAFDKAAVWHWEHGGVMASEAREAYGRLIANKLSAMLGRMVGIKLVANSPWTLSAWTQCVDCGAWFELRRRRQKRCDACICQ